MPVTAHPLFPAIVALWFAALLGIGSLVLPVALFESVVTISGINKLVAATTPPLGFTARLLIAAVCAGLGALAGLWIASKVVASQGHAAAPDSRKKVQSRDDDADARRPISAHEELGGNSIDDYEGESDKPRTGRRRALTVTDESGPSEYFDFAPVPGGSPHDQNGHAHDPAPYGDYAEPQVAAPVEDDALELGSFDAEPSRQDFNAGDYANPAPTGGFADLDALRTSEPAAPFETMTFTNSEDYSSEDAPMTSETNSPPPAQAASSATSQAIPFGARPGAADDRIMPEGQNFAAPQTFQAPVEPAPANPTPVQQAAAPIPQAFTPQHTPTAPVAPATATFANEQVQTDIPDTDRVNAAPLADLGMVELVERFARALQQDEGTKPAAQAAPEASAIPFATRAAGDAPASFDAPAFQPSETEAPAPAQEQFAAAAPAPQFAAPTAMPEAASAVPSALQPFAVDEYEDEDDEPIEALSLNLRNASAQGMASPAAQQFTASAPQTAASFAAAPTFAAAAEHQPPQQPAPHAFAPPAQNGFDQQQAAVEGQAPAEENDEAYSSLLNMRGPLGGGREFVRIDDDADEGREGVVVFPGQSDRRATPATDGPARDPGHAPAPVAPTGAPRPFDAPVGAPASATSPHADSGEAEKALRDALEKLNRMSGAA